MPRSVGADEVARLAKGHVPIVDVLPASSYKAQHLPGALHAPIDEDDFDERIRQVAPDKEAPVVVYCRDPACEASPAAAHVMEDHLGYEKVLLYEGGLVEWRRSGRDLEGQGPRRVHLGDLHRRS